MSPRCGTTMRTVRPACTDSHSSIASVVGVESRGRAPPAAPAIGVELLQRRRPRPALGDSRRPASLTGLTSSRARRRVRRRILEHLHDRARGPGRDPEASRSPSPAVAIFCCRSPSAWTVRIASRCAPPPRSARASAASAIRSLEVGDQVVARPSSSRRASATARRSAREQRAATQGATQRLMSYSRHGAPRLPVMTSLHDRSRTACG